MKTEEYSDVAVERIKISIEHLLVDKLPGIQNYEHIVGVTKHLCGSGTGKVYQVQFAKHSKHSNF